MFLRIFRTVQSVEAYVIFCRKKRSSICCICKSMLNYRVPNQDEDVFTVFTDSLFSYKFTSKISILVRTGVKSCHCHDVWAGNDDARKEQDGVNVYAFAKAEPQQSHSHQTDDIYGSCLQQETPQPLFIPSI